MDPDDLFVRRAELLRETLRDVHGDPRSATLSVGIGREGMSSTRLALNLVATRGGFALQPAPIKVGPDDELLHDVIDAVQSTDLISVYYESGHTYSNRQVAKINLTSTPFHGVQFHNFSGFNVKREKPVGHGSKQIHRNIGRQGDDSLFGWVRQHYSDGFLICDDGPGEVADFLHLASDNTLSVIHVKAAYSTSSSRGIAVTGFEQLVSQAEKSVRRLTSETLDAHLLSRPPTSRPACWTNGLRVNDRLEFLDQLGRRRPENRTYVVLIQPHLTRAAWTTARAAIRQGSRTADSFRITLLDSLLHSTRRTITSVCDDLVIFGCD